jgi:hypothetical protein
MLCVPFVGSPSVVCQIVELNLFAVLETHVLLVVSREMGFLVLTDVKLVPRGH